MAGLSSKSVEDRRIRQQAFEIGSKNSIIQGQFDGIIWSKISELVNGHERQIGFIKQSMLQGEELWDEFGSTSQNFFRKMFGKVKLNLEEQGAGHVESAEEVAQEVADAMIYIHIEGSEESPSQYDSIEGCAGGICYALRSMQAKVWWKLCVVTMFQYDSVFEHFYRALGNSEERLVKFVERNPNMLFNTLSTLFIKRLHEKLSWAKFHSLLMNLKDDDERTFIYHERNPEVLVEFYTSVHRADLYQLLGQQDNNGQTALHYNPSGLSKFLIYSFSPPGSATSAMFFNLMDLRDNNNKTAINYADDVDESRFTWLMEQAKTSCYALYKPAFVLLYNTKDRPQAEEESSSMFKVFQTMGVHPYRHENFDEEGLFEAIDDAAKRTRTALIVMVMAHGSKGVVYDANGKSVLLHMIHHRMCSYEHLKEKPKILIAQCCQQSSPLNQLLNRKPGQDSRPPKQKLQEDRSYFIPKEDHFCVYMSCVEGQMSPRNVFIPALAEIIAKSDKTTSTHELFEAVKVQMAEDGHFNIPIMHSTLHGKVCLKNMF